MKEVGINNHSIEEVFTPNRHQLEKCTKPIHKARGIPNDYYVKPECFDFRDSLLL